MSKEDLSTLLPYMKDGGWFDSPVFVVWACGPTDCWPKAIFTYKEWAEEFIDQHEPKHEGLFWRELDFRQLIKLVSAVD